MKALVFAGPQRRGRRARRAGDRARRGARRHPPGGHLPLRLRPPRRPLHHPRAVPDHPRSRVVRRGRRRRPGGAQRAPRRPHRRRVHGQWRRRPLRLLDQRGGRRALQDPPTTGPTGCPTSCPGSRAPPSSRSAAPSTPSAASAASSPATTWPCSVAGRSVSAPWPPPAHSAGGRYSIEPFEHRRQLGAQLGAASSSTRRPRRRPGAPADERQGADVVIEASGNPAQWHRRWTSPPSGGGSGSSASTSAAAPRRRSG